MVDFWLSEVDMIGISGFYLSHDEQISMLLGCETHGKQLPKDWVAAAIIAIKLLTHGCKMLQAQYSNIIHPHLPARPHLQKNGCNLRFERWIDFSGHGMPKIQRWWLTGFDESFQHVSNDMRSRNPKDVGVKKQETFKWLYDDVTSKMLEYIGKYEDEKQNNKIIICGYHCYRQQNNHISPVVLEKNTGSLRGMVHWFSGCIATICSWLYPLICFMWYRIS